MRMYELISISESAGKATVLTSEPVTHDEGVAMAKRFSHHPMRRIQLRDLGDTRDVFEISGDASTCFDRKASR